MRFRPRPCTVQIRDCGDTRRSRTPRSALSRRLSRRTGPSRPRGQDHSRFSCTPPACPAGTIGAVPFRVAVTRRARRGNTFQGDQRKVERRNASKTNARPEPPATCTLPLPGTCMPARRSLSAVSVSRSRLAGPARREQLERRDPPPAAGAAAGGVRCHRTTPPPGPPAPRVPRSDRRARGWSRRTLMCGGPRSDLRPPVHVPRL
jgi:hypothetical protein